MPISTGFKEWLTLSRPKVGSSVGISKTCPCCFTQSYPCVTAETGSLNSEWITWTNIFRDLFEKVASWKDSARGVSGSHSG
jgi:hypothetical protein